MGQSTTARGGRHFSAHASLAGIGVLLRQRDVCGPIRARVRIAQKAVRHTPLEKLYDGFVAILSGAHGLVEINMRLRGDPTLQRALGRAACAEQSVVQQTLDACNGGERGPDARRARRHLPPAGSTCSGRTKSAKIEIHEAVREWEECFAPLLAERLRAKRRGKAGRKWHADETYVKVDRRWCYLYRAIDADGNLVDSLLSKTRDMDAAKRFFARARTVVGHAPEKVTTDGHDAYPRAIRETLGPDVQHRTSRYINNRMEQDHRSIKHRYYPMRDFGSFDAAARFYTAHDELRAHFRDRKHLNEHVPLAEQRRLFQDRWGEVCALLEAA